MNKAIDLLVNECGRYTFIFRVSNKFWGKTYQTIIKKGRKIIDRSDYLEDINEAVRVYDDFCEYYENNK